jgi:hypothetical protein
VENKKEYKPMPKWLVYTLFVLKFALSLALIFWTVYMTQQSDVGKDEDNAFLKTHKVMDDDYNKIVEQNSLFSSKYNVKFIFNDTEIIGLTHQDVYLSQRNIKERSLRKNMLNVGENKVSIYIQDKNGVEVKNSHINILVTKNTTHTEDVTLEFNNETSKNFVLKSLGYWNITGSLEVDDDKGYFYLKTNARQNTTSK